MGLEVELSLYDVEQNAYVNVPVVLVQDRKVIEFPGYDIEEDLAALELGFQMRDPRLHVYNEFRHGGLAELLETHPDAIYDAFEEQGYDVFRMEYEDDDPFTPALFARMIVENLEGNKGSIEEQLSVFSEFVDFDATDAGAVTQEDYADALVRLLQKQVSADGYDIAEICAALQNVITAADVKYTVDGPYQEGDTAQNLERYNHSISILGEDMVSWERIVESQIYDPVGFQASVTDYCEHDGSWCTPSEAEAILYAFDMEADEPEDPDDPEHPISDEDGEFAVLYEHYTTEWIKGKGSVRTNELEATYVVPYSDVYDAREAIDLSEHILENFGELREWDMRILRAKTPAELQQQEFERRQLSLLHEKPPWADDPEWMDEWVLYDEDEE
jgi:hypothetical protein